MNAEPLGHLFVLSSLGFFSSIINISSLYLIGTLMVVRSKVVGSELAFQVEVGPTHKMQESSAVLLSDGPDASARFLCLSSSWLHVQARTCKVCPSTSTSNFKATFLLLLLNPNPLTWEVE